MGVFNRFKTDQRGATGLLFGIAVLPLVGAVGAAVDYSRAADQQSKIQRALDATAIALAREPATLTGSNLQQRTETIFATLYQPAGFVTRGAVTVSRTSTSVSVRSTATVQNAFMQVVGVPQSSVGGTADSTWGTQKIELALVLDNTGSMADSISGQRKIDALKNAATTLLTDLRAIATDTDTVKVSIVPFDTEVRLDVLGNPSYRGRDWYRFNQVTDRALWTGYVFDRYGTYASTDDAPVSGNSNSMFPAPRDTEYHSTLSYQSTRDLAVMKPLTSLYNYSDYQALTSLVNSMQPRGFTNIGLGAMWGYATLTPSDPFTEAAALGTKDVKKFMVILTDGDNTMSHINGSLQSNTTKIDAQTTAACTLVKQNNNVELFTIRLLDGNTTLLRNCATDSNHYFDVQNSAQLTSAFAAIVNAISGTRLTH